MLLPFARRSLLLAWALTLGGTTACRRELVGRPAPESDLYFPLGVVISQTDQRVAYVMSTNWSQRFNTGWLSVVDLDAIVSGAETPADVIRQTLLVPSLGGELSVSDDGTLLAAAFRNNNQVIVFEVSPDDGSIQCGDPDAESGLDAGDRRTDCDARHVYRFVADGLDDGFIVDQFSDPYGVRFLPPRDGTQALMVGYLSSYLGIGLVTLLDVDVVSGGEILGNQRSIELATGGSGFTVQTSAIVAPRPAPGATDPRFVAIGSRSSAGGVSSATIFGINIDDYVFKATEDTDFASVDFNNRAKIARIDIRSQAGGFTLADLVFTDDGNRAFAAVSFSQPTSGSSDSLLMLNARPRSRDIVLADDSIQVVQRPEYDVIDTLAVPGTPQSVSYVPRLNAPPLLVTATFNDNALHFVRVGETSLDAITRLDRSVGLGPVVVRHARFTPSGQSAERDFVVVTSFLSHGISIFDVTDADPSLWQQWFVESALADGRRFR
ncbi:MAG: hypothetical protein ACAI38_19510 [Myxococcota bacterium]